MKRWQKENRKFKENRGQEIDIIRLSFRPISKTSILQKLKAFGNGFLLF